MVVHSELNAPSRDVTIDFKLPDTTSRQEIKQLRISFGSIFLLSSNKF